MKVDQATDGPDKVKQEAFGPDKVLSRRRPATDKIEQEAAGPDKGAGGPPSASEGCETVINMWGQILNAG